MLAGTLVVHTPMEPFHLSYCPSRTMILSPLHCPSCPLGAYCPALSNVTSQINTYRRRHQATNVVYNQSMATQAAAHAFSVARAGCKELSVANDVPYGQNLLGYFSPQEFINQVQCINAVREW